MAACDRPKTSLGKSRIIGIIPLHIWIYGLLLLGMLSQVTLAQDEVEKTSFTFEDIWDDKFVSKSFHGRWINNSLVYKNASGDLLTWDPVSGSKNVLVDSFLFTNRSISTYYLSNNLRYMLYSYEYKQQWRYSFTAKYKIFDREGSGGLDGSIISFPYSANLSDQKLLYATWAPTGTRLSFVHDNDLYYQAAPTAAPQRITHTGNYAMVYNGVPDWLYEEDVLGDRTAQYWSPDAEFLIFATFNDSKVPLQEYPIYGPSSDVYGRTMSIPYPKAGFHPEKGKLSPNPKVTLSLLKVSDLSVTEVPVPAIFKDVDHYYLQVTWANSSHFMVNWCNRAVNHSIIIICTASQLSCAQHLETRYPKSWIRGITAPKFIDGGRNYVTLRSNNGWRQVALIPAKANAEDDIVFLTQGQREVSSLESLDNTRRVVYYRSNNGNPKDRHILRVGLPDADAALKTSICLSCDGECNYQSASFSQNGEFYIRWCYGPGIPFDGLYSTLDPKKVEILTNNSVLRRAVDSKHLPSRQFVDIPVGGGYTAHAEVSFPPGFSEDRHYPLLIVTYGGPESQEVLDFSPLAGTIERWRMYLGSMLGAVVVSVDGRGAGGRGDKYTDELYRRMGTVEVEDQAYAARYFRDKPYIDKNKDVAIYGWSYGGEVSSQALAGYPVFNCAIAVAPVISKRYYDTAYTERVMGFDLPEDNEAGYDDTDLTTKAVNMTGKKYMLVHGTQDDNVHFMNSAQMVQALTAAEVQFTFEMYVDEPHGIRNRKSSTRHLLYAMSDFLRNDCWEMRSSPPGGYTSGVTLPSQISTAPPLLFVLVLIYLFFFH